MLAKQPSSNPPNAKRLPYYLCRADQSSFEVLKEEGLRQGTNRYRQGVDADWWAQNATFFLLLEGR